MSHHGGEAQEPHIAIKTNTKNLLEMHGVFSNLNFYPDAEVDAKRA
jgi:hypothetical protein